jgi:hypothetical protein
MIYFAYGSGIRQQADDVRTRIVNSISKKGADGQLKPKSIMLLKHSDDCLLFQTYLVSPRGGQQM